MMHFPCHATQPVDTKLVMFDCPLELQPDVDPHYGVVGTVESSV